MKKTLFAAIIVSMIFALTSCGGGSSSPTVFHTQMFSDQGFDGDIEQTGSSSFVVTQGMSPTVQSVFAGIDPLTLTETRAFLDFPIRDLGGVPFNAIIESAFLDIFINSIQPASGTIPVLIELVAFQPPTLLASDFSRTLQPPLKITSIIPPISQADVGHSVVIDVTSLMIEAQRLGLSNFQLRILEDLNTTAPGLIEINDTTGASHDIKAPLLQVSYF